MIPLVRAFQPDDPTPHERVRVRERDPDGLALHEPGAKADAGKVRPALVLRGFPRALLSVAEVATYGADKYSDGGWQHVSRAETRYADAQHRHELADARGETFDPDSGLRHLAQVAWNALARLELRLRLEEREKAPPSNPHCSV